MPRSQRSASPIGRNLLALTVAGWAMGLAHLNFDPMTTGGSPTARASSIEIPAIDVPPPVPLPTRMELAAPDSAAPAQPVIAVADDPKVLRGIWAVKMAAAMLERGCVTFAKVPDYTANMFEQERIGGALGDGQTIDLKIRHEPFSVYMKWLSGDRGRQLIFVEGQNDGHLLVQPGGIKGRLTGVLNLEPTGAVAMSESRYPIMRVGLLALARTILEYQTQDIARGNGFRCELRDHQEFEGRPCYVYYIEYDGAEFNDVYRKSIVFIDKELSMPICVKNYTWARDANPLTIDNESLVEFYAYSDLRMQLQLGSLDFDQHNQDYKLRVKR